uniref:hypothetical protein n=1 Tax=Hymenobacter metallilatus TaxID=2493666 RepID=UPI001C8B83DC
HDGPLQDPLQEQLFYLRILCRFARGRWLEYRLVAAARAQVLRLTVAMTIFAQGRASAFSAGEGRV